MKLAAIDVGSNAVRLLVANVYEVGNWTPLVHKADLYRVPLRLGEDVFLKSRISEEKAGYFLRTMQAFQHLMTVCGVEDHLACATSAMRNAENGSELVERVQRQTEVDLKIIDGSQEAEYIAFNRLDGRFMEGAYLFIDVGGGSTELTLLEDGRQLAAQSFEIGTVRIKEGLVTADSWEKMAEWVVDNSARIQGLQAIGSGGNINKLFKLTRKRQEKPLTLKKLVKLHEHLKGLTLEERMVKLRLRPDRADVIVPAGQIFKRVMKWAGIEKIIVPQIGLSDGLIHALYRKHRPENGG